MTMASSESIWSTMIAARQLSATYYTISTCLTDILHRYCDIVSRENNDMSSSLLNNLYQALFASSSPVSTNLNDQSKLLAEYANVLQTILKQNSLHTNIIQNVRRLFRSDPCLKQLFTSELNEHCQCQECDCTISNSITDMIHDVGEIRARLLIDPSQISCACFRCGDQSQQKTVTFKQLSPCLALTVQRLDIKATDQLSNAQGTIYDLAYIIEFDPTSRSISNVYLRHDENFIKVDGTDISQRRSAIQSEGKFLTLWLSRSTPVAVNLPAESTSITHSDTFLSPPQSASSSSQLIPTSTAISDIAVPYQTMSSITFEHTPLPVETRLEEDDDQFWNSLTEQSTINTSSAAPTAAATTDDSSASNSDTISDLYLTLLHTTSNKSSSVNSRSEHDRAVNTLASDVLWPLLIDQTNRRSEKKQSSSTTSTVQSISSRSSTSNSTIRGTFPHKQFSSTLRSQRTHPYART